MKRSLASRLIAPLHTVREGWTRERSCLVILFLAATAIRSVPGWMNAAWGNDFGIYYGITNDFAENPGLFRPYSGWGSLYNYFPVLYVFVAFLHFLTGADIGWLLPRVTPVFGGLAVFVFYFAVKEMSQDRKAALMACAFLAANPFHIYQTSHAAPMTVGHFFMVLCLYLFVRRRKSAVSVGMLFLCSILLVASHHLTTFFFLISIVFITFYRNLKASQWTENLSWDVVYILYVSVLTFLYWMLVATPLYRDALGSSLLIPSWAVVALFYIGLFALLMLVYVQRNFNLSLERQRTWNPGIWQSVIMAVVIISSFVLLFAVVAIPGTGFMFHETAVLFLVPTMIAVGFALHGISTQGWGDAKGYALGWLYPILISLFLTTLTWHATLFPFRHLEYIAYPVAMLSAIGVVSYQRKLNTQGQRSGDEVESGEDSDTDEKQPHWKNGHAPSTSRSGFTARGFGYFVAAILVLNLASAYAVQRTTSRFQESISEEVFDVVEWMRGNVTGYNFTVASDHRISQVLWAEGYNVTSDDAYVIWFSKTWEGCLEELETANFTKPQIRYIFIDHVMRYDGVQSGINETPKNLTPESYGKFAGPPFVLVFRSESADGKRWAELYEVDWDFIRQNRP